MSESETIENNNAPDPFEEGTKEVVEIEETHEPKIPVAGTKSIFKRSDVKRSFSVGVHFPDLFPDLEPFEFEFRLRLTKDANERRQEYLALSASEMTVKLPEQALDEVCDLLVSAPKGFADLQDTGQGPGPSFRSYVETSGEAKDFLLKVVEGADNLYWSSVMPREFRRKV